MTTPFIVHPCAPRRRLLQSLCASACALAWPALAQQRSADAKAAILIGRSSALSGPMAPFLTPVHEGQEAALADFNEAGGVAGRKVQLVSLDDKFDAALALDNARRLVQDSGVVALFGQAGTSQVLALLPYLTQARTPLVAVYTGSPAVHGARSPYLFTTSASYADELVKIVRNLVAIQTTRIGVAYENNDFGKLALPLVEKAITAEGGTFVGAHAMHSSGQDAEAAAKALAALRPQAVVMIAAGPPVVAYVRANKAHLGVPVYTLSLGAGAQVIRALGSDARGLAVARTTPPPTRLTTAVAREFQASMKRHGHPVDYDRFRGYLDARILIEGLRAAGPSVTGASLAATLEGLHKVDLGGYTYQYSAQNRNGSNYVDIAVIGPDGNYMH
ncbi:ABC transporter substrate-binding protein [Diaphorobacter nitroreducens]|uniref:ABC transporter substrate-binding protein n=1 Tax=Diaphorobacter nitroreducens TaxID=164759 RepID=UPI0028A98AE3|nr:ABC transporter substrate-binding protein [Diaphorobacter nitroreducens]